MSAKDLKLIKKLDINPIWLMEIDFPSFKRFLCLKNVTSHQAEELKIVRRKFQLRKYRLENYYREKDQLSELIEKKRDLEMERIQLSKEIETFKNEISLMDFMSCLDQLEIQYK